MSALKSSLPQPKPDIISQCKQGVSESFRVIVDMYQDYVRNLIFRIVLDEEHTQDIAQNVFVKMWQNINKYDDKYLFSTWMYRIVLNTCYDFLKSRKHREHLQLEAAGTEHFLLEDTYLNRDLLKQIRIISRQLPMKQRMVFILKDLQNMTADEVSEILEMKKGAVKSNLFCARKYIREVLMKWEKLEEQS